MLGHSLTWEVIFINLLVKSFHIVRWNIWHSYGSFDIAQWDLTCAGYAHHRSVAFVKWTIWHSYVKITHDYVIFFTLPCQIFDRTMSQWHNQACRCTLQVSKIEKYKTFLVPARLTLFGYKQMRYFAFVPLWDSFVIPL